MSSIPLKQENLQQTNILGQPLCDKICKYTDESDRGIFEENFDCRVEKAKPGADHVCMKYYRLKKEDK